MVTNLDKKSRLALLRQAPLKIQELYGGEEIANLLTTIAENLGIKDEAAYDTLALTIGDVILGSYSKSVLWQLLKDRLGLSDGQETMVTDTLHDFLTKIPETKKADVPTDNVVLAPPPTIPTNPLPAEKAAVEVKPISNVKPLRTFADDVALNRAHGYGAFRGETAENDEDEPVHSSSQDDIIKK